MMTTTYEYNLKSVSTFLLVKVTRQIPSFYLEKPFVLSTNCSIANLTNPKNILIKLKLLKKKDPIKIF